MPLTTSSGEPINHSILKEGRMEIYINKNQGGNQPVLYGTISIPVPLLYAIAQHTDVYQRDTADKLVVLNFSAWDSGEHKPCDYHGYVTVLYKYLDEEIIEIVKKYKKVRH